MLNGFVVLDDEADCWEAEVDTARGTGLLGRDVEVEVCVAAHFLRTSSSAFNPAAEALFDNSEICCEAGFEVGTEVMADVDAQLWSTGKRC